MSYQPSPTSPSVQTIAARIDAMLGERVTRVPSLPDEITYEVDGRRMVAGPGASAFAPRGTNHAFQNFGTTTAHLLVMVVPAGLDRFFEELSAGTLAGQLPDMAFLNNLAQQYGITILGPPLA